MVSTSTQKVKTESLPTLVLLPGMDGTGILFENLLAALDRILPVVVAMYPTQQPTDYAGLLSVARGFLPEDKPYVLLAESFSGPIAIAIAATRPSNLRGVIFSASFASNPRPMLRLLRWILHPAWIAAIPQAWFKYILLGPFASTALSDKIAVALSQVTPEVLCARASAVLTVDERAALSRIQVPMLYLQASADRAVSAYAFEQIKQRACQCQLEVFLAPHFLLQTASREAAASILTFVESCDKKMAACAAESGEEKTSSVGQD